MVKYIEILPKFIHFGAFQSSWIDHFLHRWRNIEWHFYQNFILVHFRAFHTGDFLQGARGGGGGGDKWKIYPPCPVKIFVPILPWAEQLIFRDNIVRDFFTFRIRICICWGLLLLVRKSAFWLISGWFLQNWLIFSNREWQEIRILFFQV